MEGKEEERKTGKKERRSEVGKKETPNGDTQFKKTMASISTHRYSLLIGKNN